MDGSQNTGSQIISMAALGGQTACQHGRCPCPHEIPESPLPTRLPRQEPRLLARRTTSATSIPPSRTNHPTARRDADDGAPPPARPSRWRRRHDLLATISTRFPPGSRSRASWSLLAVSCDRPSAAVSSRNASSTSPVHTTTTFAGMPCVGSTPYLQVASTVRRAAGHRRTRARGRPPSERSAQIIQLGRARLGCGRRPPAMQNGGSARTSQKQD